MLCTDGGRQVVDRYGAHAGLGDRSEGTGSNYFSSRVHTRSFAPDFSRSATMSALFHAVTRADNLYPCGYLPEATPAHQLEREMGNTANTCGRRRKPSSGRIECVIFWGLQMETPAGLA